MPGVSLSEAILSAVACAIPGQSDLLTLALKGLKVLPPDLDASNRYFVPAYGLNQYQAHAYPKETLVRVRPWLNEEILCQWCARPISGAEIISHPIEEHDDEIGLKDECEWLEEMEGDPERRANGLAIYFPSNQERRRVLDAAQSLQVSSSSFVTGALRLVLEYGLQPVSVATQ